MAKMPKSNNGSSSSWSALLSPEWSLLLEITTSLSNKSWLLSGAPFCSVFLWHNVGSLFLFHIKNPINPNNNIPAPTEMPIRGALKLSPLPISEAANLTYRS
uniref:Uncharacterized protein n=1 Tax=Rhizophora mucronata TaxID=61149 RepID=A0A2P2Q753_RHIMU